MTNPQHIMDAYIKVATVDHYLVTVDTAGLSWEDLHAAQQLLITESNARNNLNPIIELALDLCERDLERKRRAR